MTNANDAAWSDRAIRGYEGLGLHLLHRLDPERAHTLSLTALRAGLVPLPRQITSPRLATQVAGLSMANPVGLAAGYDKNAEALLPLSRAGFGFLEVGAATPRAQSGNPRPRLFRLSEDRAVINRFGFNNQGMAAIAARLARRPRDAVIGLNLGANKDSDDRARDFCAVLETCAANLDFATVNVSSPNTEKLRDLQGKAALSVLLTNVLQTRDALTRRIPIFLKIAPDLDAAALADISSVALDHGLDGIITTNTTLDRTGLTSAHRTQAGGLSGAPLFEKSTRVLAHLSQLTQGRIPLIGVGGIATPEQAYEKIRAGASAVQLYSALVFGGLSLTADIVNGLDMLLARDGFGNVAEAVGTGRKQWL